MKRKVVAIICMVAILIMSLPATSFAFVKRQTTAYTTPKTTTKKVVTLKIGASSNWTNEKPGVQVDAVAKEIERVTGVKIYFYPQTSPELFNTWIASGDLPDILTTNRYVNAQLIKSKSVIPLNKYLKTNAPNLSKLTTTLNYDKTYQSDGKGNLYFLTMGVQDWGFDGVNEGYNIRWDYYKAMGSPEVKNMDDYLQVLADMQEKYPTNKDGKKVYGLSPYFDWGMWSWTIAGYLYGRAADNRMMDMDMTTNAMTYLPTDENGSFWKTVETYYKANKLGIMDPDSFTQKFDNALQKGRDLRVLGGWCNFWFGDPNATFKAAGEAKGFIAIPPAKGTTAMWTGWYQPLGGDSHYSVTKSCKYPDRAVELIDYFFSEAGTTTLRSGVKGTHWDMINGTPKIKQSTIDLQTKDTKFKINTGIGKFQSGLSDFYYGTMLNLFKDPQTEIAQYSPLQKSYFKEFGAKNAAELVKSRVKTYMGNTAPMLLQPLVPDDIKRIDDSIITYMTTQAPKAVMAKNYTEYVKVKKEILAGMKKINGYQTSYNYWTKVFKDMAVYMEKNKLWDIPADYK